MGRPEARLLADATELVLDRLDAWLAGDQDQVARIDARAPKDATSLAALAAAASGIAEQTFSALATLDPAAADDLLHSFREQLLESRLRPQPPTV